MKNLVKLLFVLTAIFAVAVGLGLDFVEGVAAAAVVPLQDARNIYTKALIRIYNEKTEPTMFLRSFFNTQIKSTKEISIEVRRGTEKLAVDVTRGTNGNYNKRTKSTEKIFLPPYYNEYFSANDLAVYDAAINNPTVGTMAVLASESAEKLREITNLIDRAYEKQCADVFTDGILPLENGSNIDFKRKAGSLVAYGAGTDWSINTVDPAESMRTAAEFIRKEGKYSGGIFNVILGDDVVMALLNNDILQKRSDIKDFKLADVHMPQRNSTGGVLHGSMSAGPYTFMIWSYPEFYENAAGTLVSYLDPKKAVFLPQKTDFDFSYAAVPQLMTRGGSPKKGKFLIQDFIDDRRSNHDIDVKSAGIAIPVAVDTIYTLEVLN